MNGITNKWDNTELRFILIAVANFRDFLLARHGNCPYQSS